MPMDAGLPVVSNRSGLLAPGRSFPARVGWPAKKFSRHSLPAVPPAANPVRPARKKWLARQDLITAVWGDEDAVGISEQAMDAWYAGLETRLSQLDPKHPYVITVRGHGLRLENPKSEQAQGCLDGISG